MISRIERIADTAPRARSEDELRSLGSQAMGTAIAIKEEFEDYGISTESSRMRRLLEELDTRYDCDLPELRSILQIALHQVAGYYRGLAERL
jgi:hypothetical protein